MINYDETVGKKITLLQLLTTDSKPDFKVNYICSLALFKSGPCTGVISQVFLHTKEMKDVC